MEAIVEMIVRVERIEMQKKTAGLETALAHVSWATIVERIEGKKGEIIPRYTDNLFTFQEAWGMNPWGAKLLKVRIKESSFAFEVWGDEFRELEIVVYRNEWTTVTQLVTKCREVVKMLT